MPQEILDRGKCCIRIQQLRCHGMAQVMTGDVEPCSAGIILHALLDAAHRQGLTSAESFLYQKEFLGSCCRPSGKIGNQCIMGIVTEVYHPVFCPFTIADKYLAALQVQCCTCSAQPPLQRAARSAA